MFNVCGAERIAWFRGTHPHITIYLFPHAAHENDLSQALQVIGTMSVFVIVMLMPICVLKINNVLFSAVVAIFQDPFFSRESPTCQ